MYLCVSTSFYWPGSLYPEEVMMLKPFSISPSYQSELSDCSFFPPTHSSLAREAQQPSGCHQSFWPHNDDTLSTSMDMLLPGDKYDLCKKWPSSSHVARFKWQVLLFIKQPVSLRHGTLWRLSQLRQRIVISFVTDHVSLRLSSRPRSEVWKKYSKFFWQSQGFQTKLHLLPRVFHNR